MNPSEQINQIVDNLASKLGIAVEKVGPIAETLVRETYAMGWAYVGFSVVLLCVGCVASYAMCRAGMAAEKNKSSGYSNPGGDYFAAAAGTFVLAFLVFILTVASNIHNVVAPTLSVVNEFLR